MERLIKPLPEPHEVGTVESGKIKLYYTEFALRRMGYFPEFDESGKMIKTAQDKFLEDAVKEEITNE